jgi:hypothetical protein
VSFYKAHEEYCSKLKKEGKAIEPISLISGSKAWDYFPSEVVDLQTDRELEEKF